MFKLFFSKIKKRIIEVWEHAGFQKYFKNTGWFFLSKISSMVLSFVSTVFMVRYFLPEQYGLLNYAISYVGLFSFISTLGLDSVLYRDLVKEPEKKEVFFGSALVIRLSGAVIGFLFIVFSLFIFPSNTDAFYIILIIAGIYFFQPFSIASLYFQANVNSKIIAIYGFVVTVILSLLKILFVFLHIPVIGFALIFLLEPILFGLAYCFAYYLAGESLLKWKYSFEIVKRLLNDAWPLMFSGAFAVIYMRIDQVMLKHYLDNYAVGIYSVAAQLSEYWYIFPLIIVNSLVPAIVNARTAGEEVYKRRKAYLFKLIIGVSVFIALIFTVFADFFIRVIYGANYLDAVGVLRIYVWGGLGMSLGLVVNQLFIVENRTKMYFVANFLSMLVNVILNIVMIPKFGMSGAAFATLIAYSFIPMPYFIFKSKSKGNITVYEAVS